MKISENSLKWLMRLYPPMLFQRIWVKRVHKDFRGVEVKINRSLFTTNLGNSIFGGTIFSATDPFYALLLGQIMQRQGFRVTVWLKSAQISYLKPARTDLFYTIQLNSNDVSDAVSALTSYGKFVRGFPIDIFDTHSELCATATNEVYIRNLDFPRASVEETPGRTSP